MEALIEKAKDKGPAALLVVVVLAIGIVLGQGGLALTVADGMTDEELRAELCGPAEAPAKEVKVEADAGE